MASTGLEDGSLPLPQGFTSIQDILDGKIKAFSKARVIGLVCGSRAPVPTKGPDYKCQLELYDASIQWDCEQSLRFNIFRSADKMPAASRGDVIAILDAKVQQFQGHSISLLSSWATNVVVYKASKIPRPPQDASVAVSWSDNANSRLSQAENHFISAWYHSVDKERLPTEIEFETRKVESANIKDKLSLLKDVKDGKFYDLIVELVKMPYDGGDKFTLWVSDYTEHPAFFNHSLPLAQAADGRDGQDGDPHGYLTKFGSISRAASEWTGPFGKRSLQVTCYEPHASVIRECKLKQGSWVQMKNVQIKYGANGSSLEGFLREDRGALGLKINLFPQDPHGNPENITPGLKDAIRRKRDYEKLKKMQTKELEKARVSGQKRRAALEKDLPGEPDKKSNSKDRRKQRRAQAAEKAEREKQARALTPDLNQQVRCENQSIPASSIAEILCLHSHQIVDEGEPFEVQLPFVNVNHRAHVRVVNFFPPQLEEFTCVRQIASEYEILSDHDDADDSSDEECHGMSQDEAGEWEWRFFLEVEDAAVSAEGSKKRLWAFVDNQAAQCLLNLDASDLTRDSTKLDMLREKMFLLWGDLEEKMRGRAQRLQRRRNNELPPPDSSDEDCDGDGVAAPNSNAQVNNRPFSCCIRQFGVKMPESDASKADAGEAKRWERVYGLFGTRVSEV